MKKTALFLLLAATMPTACIQDEAPNAEADILSITLPEGVAIENTPDYYRSYDSQTDAYPISIEVAFGTDLSAISPTFELTPGATLKVIEKGDTIDVETVNSKAQNFSTPVRYIVTSESRMWQRVYLVDIRYPEDREIPTKYHFESVIAQGNYYLFHETADGCAPLTWASGNPGFDIAAQLQGITSPHSYPTTIEEEGYSGRCLKLQTLLTGEWGERVGKPIAAGNLFMGTFYLPTAITNSLNSTRFGIPFKHRATALVGYYRYTAGKAFYDNGNYTDEKDKFSIYAIFFEKGDDVPYLDGHIPSQGFNHPRIVATALMEESEKIESSEWRRFEIPFDYTRYGKEIDPEKLAAGKYQIAVVFASSSGGDEFKGAPGSTLYIDEVELLYE